MDIARYFIKNTTTSWILTLTLLIGGVVSYGQLGQLEDPEFVLKQAIISTQYPGASPEQVEEEVSYPIENALQELPYVHRIESISSAGLSQIIVEMKSTYRANELRQIWDEMRRKVNDLKRRLPPGVEEPLVKDDFGDVYGILMSITGDGYQYQELRDYVDYLRRELILVDGVGKVSVEGLQQHQVIIEISRNKLSSLGIAPSYLYQLLSTQNVVSNAGSIRVGDENIRFHPTGEFQSVEELGDLIISQSGHDKRIRLSDVASIYLDYQDVPSHLLRHNGKPALAVGISFASGENVVTVGERINHRLIQLKQQRPYGIELHTVYNQPNEVKSSVDGFILNLIEAIAIVMVVLLLFMGFKAGVLIGLILLITVVGSFIFMMAADIQLQRISLGALIIALGMLVDNAIVVTEGILIGRKKGLSTLESASLIVNQTKWPLLGATFIAVIAFAPIGLSSDATGEFAGSLFWVLFISLLLSWITAITITPFFANKMLTKVVDNDTSDDPYKGGVYQGYKGFLQGCLAKPKTTMALMGLAFVISMYGFTQVKQAFFPASNTPMFYLDVWKQEGSDIRATRDVAAELESLVLQMPGVEFVSTTVGRGTSRFMLTYETEKSYSSYAQLIIRIENREMINSMISRLKDNISSQHPDLEFKFKRMEIGPGSGAKIEARFVGADPNVLRKLAEQAKDLMRADPGARNITDNWRQMTKVIRPQFNEVVAREMGISKQDVDDLLLTNFSGKSVGLYRDGTQLLPIIVRPPELERRNLDTANDLQIYSPTLRRYIPINQVVSGFDVSWENPLIKRQDRKRTLTVMADHDILGDETAAKLFARIRPLIEAIQLPQGYSLEWGGEYESSQDAQKAVFGPLPLGFLVMFIITTLLFDSARSALVIWTTVPLAVIGVTVGLLSTGAPFGFMALLGFLSLSGMLIKNGIVLVEQINIELDEGKTAYVALIDAAVSRVRPVAMAAITTILGMIPLLFDDFFQSMAVVIMFGLGFATVLTLIVVPTMYALLNKEQVLASNQ